MTMASARNQQSTAANMQWSDDDWAELHKAIDECRKKREARVAAIQQEAKKRPGVWPAAELEEAMLKDASFLKHSVHKIESDCASHIFALLQRVRELEKELGKK